MKPPPDPASAPPPILVGRVRPDRSTYYICPEKPGFHYIVAEEGSLDGLLKAFREFMSLRNAALAAQPPEPLPPIPREVMARVLDKHLGGPPLTENTPPQPQETGNEASHASDALGDSGDPVTLPDRNGCVGATSVGTPPQPGDAERLARLRDLDAIASHDNNHYQGQSDVRFLLSKLDAAQSALAEVEELNRECTELSIKAQQTIAEVEAELAASQAEVARLTAIIEDGRSEDRVKRITQDLYHIPTRTEKDAAAIIEASDVLLAQSREISRIRSPAATGEDKKSAYETAHRLFTEWGALVETAHGQQVRIIGVNTVGNAIAEERAAARAQGVREGAEKMRALYEAVIEAASEVRRLRYSEGEDLFLALDALDMALAARDAAGEQ